MTNRISTEDAKGQNGRRGAEVSFPPDITADEICFVLKSCGWWRVLFDTDPNAEQTTQDAVAQ